jgi:hypothetical protein
MVRAPQATCFMLVSCLDYSSTLRMVATFPSEMLVKFQRITWRYILEDVTLQTTILSAVLHVYETWCPVLKGDVRFDEFILYS